MYALFRIALIFVFGCVVAISATASDAPARPSIPAIDLCKAMPAEDVEAALAAGGSLASVQRAEARSLSCSYTLETGGASATLTIGYNEMQSEADAKMMAQMMGSGVPGTAQLSGVGDEAYLTDMAAAGQIMVTYRKGVIIGQVALRFQPGSGGIGADAVVEVARQWTDRLGTQEAAEPPVAEAPLPQKEEPPVQEPPAEQPATDYAALAEQLAADLMASESLEQAVRVTEKILSLGGVPTSDLEKTLVPAVEPSVRYAAIPEEVLNLAMEFRNEGVLGRMTMADLGRMMTDLGWEAPAGTDTGELVMRIMTIWMNMARMYPAEPTSFTPIFLAELHRLKDLQLKDYAGTDVELTETWWLTLLELELFAAAFLREGGVDIGRADYTFSYDYAYAGPAPFARVILNHTPEEVLTDYAEPMLLPEPACDQFKKWLDENDPTSKVLGESFAGQEMKSRVEGAFKKGIEQAYGGKTAEMFERVKKVLDIANKVFKLAAYYSHAQVTVEAFDPQGTPITEKHKPLSTRQPIYFKATAGVSSKDLEEYEELLRKSGNEGLRSCLRTAGFPTKTDIGDVAKEAENWRVNWKLIADKEHARWVYRDRRGNVVTKFDYPGQLGMYLKRKDASSAETAPFYVDILPEEKHSGIDREVDVTARANLEMDNSKDAIKSLFGFVLEGVKQAGQQANPFDRAVSTIGAMVDMAAGWFLNVVNPTNTATVKVTYHMPGALIRYTEEDRRECSLDDFTEICQYRYEMEVYLDVEQANGKKPILGAEVQRSMQVTYLDQNDEDPPQPCWVVLSGTGTFLVDGYHSRGIRNLFPTESKPGHGTLGWEYEPVDDAVHAETSGNCPADHREYYADRWLEGGSKASAGAYDAIIIPPYGQSRITYPCVLDVTLIDDGTIPTESNGMSCTVEVVDARE